MSDPINGPRRFLGNHFERLLPKDKISYTDWIGTDRRGRWVFRDKSSTLILDPTVADVAPRLPAWNITVDGGSAGWDANDYPAVKRGGAWSLVETGWKVMDESKRPLQNKRADVPPIPAPTIVASTNPTTNAATNPTTMPSLLLTEKDGTQFFDGTSELLVRHPDGTLTHIPLPANATGQGPVTLIRADGHLFLFNDAGRAVRLTDNATHTEVIVDGAFTKGLPAEATRIWKDPANRIAIVSKENHLTILFPEGHIPVALVPLVPPERGE